MAIRSLLAVLTLIASLAITGAPASAINTCVTSLATGTTMLLASDCTTDTTIFIPDGMTFDGAGHTITAVDPALGHFTGAVLRNASDASVVHVTNVIITGQFSADICDAGDARLRGILFDGAGGTITNNQLFDIRQGTTSGCQEGNAIEVRNFDAMSEPVSPRVRVTISDNLVRGYQKTGIVANGGVEAIIGRNVVEGDGPITFIAQNGIQVGFGATALISANAISGNNYTPNSFFACGIIVVEADGVDAKPQDNLYPPQGDPLENEKNYCGFHRGGNFEPYAR